jgi:hypothetical protein
MYSMTYLDSHILYIAMILCRLFGIKKTAHFSVEWVAIMNEVAEVYTLTKKNAFGQPG